MSDQRPVHLRRRARRADDDRADEPDPTEESQLPDAAVDQGRRRASPATTPAAPPVAPPGRPRPPRAGRSAPPAPGLPPDPDLAPRRPPPRSRAQPQQPAAQREPRRPQPASPQPPAASPLPDGAPRRLRQGRGRRARCASWPARSPASARSLQRGRGAGSASSRPQLERPASELAENQNPSYAGLGGRASAMLRLAEEEAAEVRDEAERDAAEIREQATARRRRRSAPRPPARPRTCGWSSSRSSTRTAAA